MIDVVTEYNLIGRAREFAMSVHEGHKRKYTEEPYWKHLAEVAGLTASLSGWPDAVGISVAWLHDTVEDCGVSEGQLRELFGDTVAQGVMWLSDLEQGNRAVRKALSRERLSRAPGWVQSIKCADLISNTSSIVQHDPKFAKLYLEEKLLTLQILKNAQESFLELAFETHKEAEKQLEAFLGI